MKYGIITITEDSQDDITVDISEVELSELIKEFGNSIETTGIASMNGTWGFDESHEQEALFAARNFIDQWITRDRLELERKITALKLCWWKITKELK